MNAPFGLIGHPLGHSFSREIHARFGRYAYELFPLPPEELAPFLRAKAFRGLNVTIPYKQAVIPFLDELSPRARAIGAVNTVLKRADGSLFGDNTDFCGLEALARRAGIPLSGKVAVFGNGGTSRTARAVVRAAGGTPVAVSRHGADATYAELSAHADADAAINTTPVGMYPETETQVADLAVFRKLRGFIDVVYNPARTRLLQQAEELGIPRAGGLGMLVGQACAACELFTGKPLEEGLAEKILDGIARKTRSLVLVGMPGSGKTSLGKAWAAELGRSFRDTDREIAARAGKSIPRIFAEDGEAAFRALESEVVRDFGKESGIVLATGGGAVLDPENRKNLRQNALVVRLVRPPDALPRDGRPLSKDLDALRAMAAAREPFYRAVADETVENRGSFAETLGKLLAIQS